MKVYFLRHTEAEDNANDDIRKLTKKGQKDARSLGEFLRRNDISFDAAYASPLVRAKETAEIVLKSCDCLEGSSLQIVPAMRNETTVPMFQKWFEALPAANSVLLVGHSPSLVDRVGRLLALNPEAIKLPKGGLLCIDTENRRTGTLKFFISPKLL